MTLDKRRHCFRTIRTRRQEIGVHPKCPQTPFDLRELRLHVRGHVAYGGSLVFLEHPDHVSPEFGVMKTEQRGERDSGDTRQQDGAESCKSEPAGEPAASRSGFFK
ncbi:MAG: hypothetical protein QGH60_13550 [Phycisphaerae bacterium]|nr:hypothetical protein [Phycisphaerae bacterium]